MSYSKNDTVNQYIDHELDPALKELFLKIRETVLAAQPDFAEDIKWKNCLTYSARKNAIQTVVGKDKITLIFFEGAVLQDPDSLLEGDGKKTRSYRITESSFDSGGLQALVKQAYSLAS